MKFKLSSVVGIVLTSIAIPIFFSALSPVEHWTTADLYQRGVIGYYGYAVVRIAEMALFALATIYLAYQVFSSKRWTIPSLGIGLVISVILLVTCTSSPLFEDFDMLRAFLTTAYAATFLIALSGKLNA